MWLPAAWLLPDTVLGGLRWLSWTKVQTTALHYKWPDSPPTHSISQALWVSEFEFKRCLTKALTLRLRYPLPQPYPRALLEEGLEAETFTLCCVGET